MINDSIFNEQKKTNEISNGTSNSTQRCLTINDNVQKQMKVLWTLNMQVLMLGIFSFLLSFFLSFFLLLLGTKSH
jgi:hypothetical protein